MTNDPTGIYAKLFAFLKSNGISHLVIMASGRKDDIEIEDSSFVLEEFSSKEDRVSETLVDYIKRNNILEYHLDNVTISKHIESFTYDILGSSPTLNWWDGSGGVVELTVDLTASDPIVVAKHHYRVIGFQPAGTFVYDVSSDMKRLAGFGYKEDPPDPVEFGLLDDPFDDDTSFGEAVELISLTTGWDEVPEDTTLDTEED